MGDSEEKDLAMSTQVTVTLPDNIYRRAQRLAELSGLDVEDIIAEHLEKLMPPLSSEMDTRPVQTLSDDEVLIFADSMMEEPLSSLMSVLLQKQQAGELTDMERGELKMLMDIYGVGQIRKAQAMVEAVRRGLREALKP
jgi:hypothetical protein